MNLAETLASFDGRDGFNAKQLQAAARFSCIQSAYNLMAREPEWYRQTYDLFHRLPRPVQHAALRCFTDGLPYVVIPREKCDGTPPLEKTARLVKACADFNFEWLEALRDGRMTADEYAELAPMLDAIERTVAQVKESMMNKRPMRVA
jgi:hypothetical protein